MIFSCREGQLTNARMVHTGRWFLDMMLGEQKS